MGNMMNQSDVGVPHLSQLKIQSSPGIICPFSHHFEDLLAT